LTFQAIDECGGKLDVSASAAPPGDWKNCMPRMRVNVPRMRVNRVSRTIPNSHHGPRYHNFRTVCRLARVRAKDGGWVATLQQRIINEFINIWSARKAYYNSHLIVSVPMKTVEAIDRLIAYPYGRDHPAQGNRSEFVRVAIREKLNREKRRRT
jgi:hypothetical protein